MIEHHLTIHHGASVEGGPGAVIAARAPSSRRTLLYNLPQRRVTAEAREVGNEEGGGMPERGASFELRLQPQLEILTVAMVWNLLRPISIV
jgi:hypothetical protein